MKKSVEKNVLGVLFVGLLAAVCGIGLDRPIMGIAVELVCGFLAIDIALGEELVKEVKEALNEVDQFLDKDWELRLVAGEADKKLAAEENAGTILVTPHVPKLALPYYLEEPEGSETEIIELFEREARQSDVAEVQKAIYANDTSLDGAGTIESITMDKDGVHLYSWCAGESADIHCSWGGDPCTEYSEY